MKSKLFSSGLVLILLGLASFLQAQYSVQETLSSSHPFATKLVYLRQGGNVTLSYPFPYILTYNSSHPLHVSVKGGDSSQYSHGTLHFLSVPPGDNVTVANNGTDNYFRLQVYKYPTVVEMEGYLSSLLFILGSLVSLAGLVGKH